MSKDGFALGLHSQIAKRVPLSQFIEIDRIPDFDIRYSVFDIRFS